MKAKRILSVIIAFAMVIGTMGFTVFAAESEGAIDTMAELVEAVKTANSELTAGAILTVGEGESYELDLNGCTVNMGAYYIENKGTLIIDNGTLVSENSENGIHGAPLYNHGGNLTVNGGEYIGCIVAVRVEGGTATIEDGTFRVTSTTGSSNCLIRMKGDTLTVNGGIFIGNYADNGNEGCMIMSASDGTTNINGGTFSGFAGIPGAIFGDGVGVSVYGGVFDPAITENFSIQQCPGPFLAENAIVTYENIVCTKVDGTVKEVTGGARIGSTFYEDLQTAVNEANVGDEVTLLGDVTISERISITKGITLNGAGHKITLDTDSRVIDVPEEAVKADVTIKNLEIARGTTSLFERAINYNTNGKLTLDKVTVSGATYAINFPGSSSEAEVEIKNSNLTGLNTINIWGSDMTIKITETNITSVDTASHENYAAVKLNNDGETSAEGTVVTIEGGTITSLDEDGEPSAATANSTATGKIEISETTTVVGNDTTIVANIDYGTEYFYGTTSLQGAVNRASQDGATVILLKDIALDSMVTVPAGKAMTLDLNGKTISTNFETASGNDFALCVAYGADITIADNSAEQTGTIDGSKVNGAVKMTNTGDDINNGTAKLTVKSGELIGLWYTISGNGSRNGTEILIEGGTITAVGSKPSGFGADIPAGYGIFHPQDGLLKVTGGTISALTGIEMRGGKLVVEGGTIESTDTELRTILNDSGTTVSGAAIAVSQHSTDHPIDIKVTKGELKGPYAIYQDRLITNYKPSTNVTAEIGSAATINGKVEAAENGFEFKNVNGSYTLEVKETWTTGTDAGAYGEGLGMMRWLFAFDIDGEVEESGIKYIKAANISENVSSSNFAGASKTGDSKAFYGDIIGITNGDNGKYVAVAYVKVDGKTYWSKPIENTPNFERVFADYVPEVTE